MNESVNILIVEDEEEIRDLISIHLQRQGYEVGGSDSVENALEQIKKRKFSLVLLDWMLPGQSGIAMIDRLKRQEPNIGILMISARAGIQDVVLGLERGADDYITKPFDIDVLLARVRALVRRSQNLTINQNQKIETLQLGELKIYPSAHLATLRDEQLNLTPSEFKLLVAMLKGVGKVLTRDQLIEQIQGEGVNVTERTVDTHIFGLRKKLGIWSEKIETIRGIGYRVSFDPHDQL